uniref:Leucine rich repeat containing protein n=1 Tax=Echinococcus granulosus TaxID=6210 RepID=A0A068WA01_ECHGR|nr:leucine rich repeat containing protein [Echinococcus granulosus]
MKQFARGLAVSKLEKLNYSFNQIGPTLGCRELVQGLKNNRCLQELDLSGNLISPQGCVILSKALAANKHLSKINFARNPFQSAGCFALLTGALKNRGSKLTELNFEDIVVNDDFKILVDKSFKLLPNLRVIHGSKLTVNDLTTYSLKMYAPTGTPPKRWLIAMHQLQNKTNRPLLPFLIEADMDKDMKLSRWETTKALELYFRPLAIGLAPAELQGLLKELDPHEENEVKISDFIENPYPKPGHHKPTDGEESRREAPVGHDDVDSKKTSSEATELWRKIIYSKKASEAQK